MLARGLLGTTRKFGPARARERDARGPAWGTEDQSGVAMRSSGISQRPFAA